MSKRVEKTERNLMWVKLYSEEGLTLEEIGQRYKCTRERVRQVLYTYGITGSDSARPKKWLTLAQAADLLGKPVCWVSRQLKVLGVAETRSNRYCLEPSVVEKLRQLECGKEVVAPETAETAVV